MKSPRISLDEVDALQRELTLAGAIAPEADDRTGVKYGKPTAAPAPMSSFGSNEQFQYTTRLDRRARDVS